MAHIHRKKKKTMKLIETVPEETQTLDSPNKELNSAILNMFWKLKEIKKMMSQWIENIGRRIEIMKRNQEENLELKSIITEIKNPLEGRFEQAQERILWNLRIVQIKLSNLRGGKKKNEGKWA